MDTSQLVSVVIPVYNAERSILSTLTSVIRQTYSNLEIIIVNDGSTDRSRQLLTQFKAKEESRFPILLINQENSGVSKARNEGMKRAKGDYIALLDGDDEWLPNKLETQMNIFYQHPAVDFLGTNRNGEHWKKWFLKDFSTLTPISARLLLYKTFFVTPSVVFKRKILDTVGYFDEAQRHAEEGDYWIRICHRHHCVLLNESLVITGGGKPNFGHSGLSSNLLEMEKGELKNMQTGYRMGVVGKIEYGCLVLYSIIKYIRRLLVVKLRRWV